MQNKELRLIIDSLEETVQSLLTLIRNKITGNHQRLIENFHQTFRTILTRESRGNPYDHTKFDTLFIGNYNLQALEELTEYSLNTYLTIYAKNRRGNITIARNTMLQQALFVTAKIAAFATCCYGLHKIKLPTKLASCFKRRTTIKVK